MSSVVLRRMLYDPSSESLGPAVRSRSALALAVTIQVLEAGTDSMSMCWLLIGFLVRCSVVMCCHSINGVVTL